MIRNNKLFSGSAIYLLSNVLSAAMPFVLLPILTRYLSPEEYGQVAMFQTLIAALAAFIGVNVHGAAIRKYYDEDITEKGLREYIGACLMILLVSSMVVFWVLFFFKGSLAQWLGLEERWVLWAVVVSVAGFVINLRLGQWQARRAVLQYGALQVSSSLANMLLSLLLVIVLLKGVEGRISAQLWVFLFFAIVSLCLLLKDGLLALSWRPDLLSEAFRFGVPLIPHVAGLFLLNAVDRVVINAELGLEKAGIYMVAVQLAAVMGVFFDAINKAYVPWLFERLGRNVLVEKQQIVLWTYRYFLVVLVAAVLAFVFGRFFVVLIAGEQYAEAGSVVGWLALGQAFHGMYLMVTNYIFYSKKTGLLSVSTISTGILNIGLLVVLVDMFGLVGAGMAYAISLALRFLFTWRVAQIRHPMPWFDFGK